MNLREEAIDAIVQDGILDEIFDAGMNAGDITTVASIGSEDDERQIDKDAERIVDIVLAVLNEEAKS